MKIIKKNKEIIKLIEDDFIFCSEKKKNKKANNIINALNKKFNEIKELIEIKNLTNEDFLFVNKELHKIKKKITKIKIKICLNKKKDKKNAIISLFSGQGGLDAEDFCKMLFKMYIKYCKRKNFKTKIIDIQKNNENGIKNVTILIKAKFAYGYFKNENGIHRLVRISPFNSNKKRQTSFLSVNVIPKIKRKNILKNIEKEIKIETFKASGKGGQHVNKTESAVRITHIPSKISTVCRAEKSQNKNKKIAIEILKSKIIENERNKKEKEKEIKKKKKKKNSFGSQIRNYIFFPYKLIKDIRTNFKTRQINKILDGDLEKLILNNIFLL